MLAVQIEQLEAAVAAIEKQLMAWHKSNPISQRLASERDLSLGSWSHIEDWRASTSTGSTKKSLTVNGFFTFWSHPSLASAPRLSSLRAGASAVGSTGKDGSFGGDPIHLLMEALISFFLAVVADI